MADKLICLESKFKSSVKNLNQAIYGMDEILQVGSYDKIQP